MKKLIGFLMVGLIVMGCSGCSDESKNKNKTENEPTLTWYVPGSKQTDIALVMEEANKILKKELGCSLDIRFIDGGAFTEKMNMMMASSEEFDLCFSGYVNPYTNAVKQGSFLPLNELIEKEAPNLKKELPDYLWDSVSIKDEIYAVPNLQLLAFPTAIYMLKDYVDKYNFDIDSVKTIGDIEPFLETITKNEPDMYAFSPSTGVGPWVSSVEEPLGTGMVIHSDDESIKVLKRYETKEYLNGVNTLRSWYEKGYIRKDIASTLGQQDSSKITKNVCWASSYKPGVEQEHKSKSGQTIVCKILSPARITTSNCTQTMTAISITTQDKVKSMKLIEKMNTDKDFYNLISFGIENKHYKKTDALHVKTIENSGYSPSTDWMFGNQLNAYLLEGKEDDTWTKTAKMNSEADKSKLLGFTFDTDSVINQLSQCETIVTEYAALENGSMDPKTIIPKYSQKMKEAGFDKVVEEIQKQINEFLAQK